MATQKIKHNLHKRLAISAAVAATFLAGYGSRRSYAGTCTGATGTYTCSGAAGTDNTQSINSNANPLSITTTAGFGINASSSLYALPPYAFGLRNNASGSSITFTDNNNSTITGVNVGIDTINYGKGATSITTTGTVTGASLYGIKALNQATATNITINSATVTGGVYGIYVRNTGTGATSITSTGAVTGTNGRGIYARNNTTTTNLTISTAAVTGGRFGIYAHNSGTGATSITSTGTVTGTGGNSTGIYARNYNNTTNLTISTAAVTGGRFGIYAHNSGTGATSITSTGAVTGGGEGEGIRLTTSTGSTNTITLNAGASVSAASNNAITDTAGNTTVVMNTGSSITGSIALGNGDDTIRLAGGNFSNVSTFDGGSGTNDRVIFAGSTGVFDQSKMAGIETVIIDSGSTMGLSFIGNAFNATALTGSNLTVQNGGILNASNGFVLTGNLINSTGVVSMQNNTIDAPATISGNYTGGGQLLLDANFATNSADKLSITGNVLAGGTSVQVNDVSTGAATGQGITLVSVGGSTTTGDFTLAAPVARGAFNYNRLALVGKDWVLQSVAQSTPSATSTPAVAFTPVAASFETLGQSMLTLANLPTLIERITGRIGGLNLNTGANSGDDTKAVTPVWFRLGGGYRDIDSASSTTGASFMTKQWQTQVGIDIPVVENAFGRFVAGVNAGYNVASTDVTSTAGKSNLDTKGYSLGLSGTWYSLNNLYVDLQLQRGWYDTNLSAGGVGAGKVKGVGSNGYSTSVEVGKALPLNKTLDITPQVQLTYATLDTDNFTGANAEIVKLSTSKSLRARLGAVLKKRLTEDGSSNGFVLANVTREFEDKTQVNVSGAQLINAVDRWTGQLGLGLSHAWTKGLMSYEVSGVAAVSTSLNNLGNSTAAQGQLNFRVSF